MTSAKTNRKEAIKLVRMRRNLTHLCCAPQHITVETIHATQLLTFCLCGHSQARWIIRRSKKERKPSDLGDALGAEEDDSNEEDDDDEEDENNTGRETGGKNEEARRQARELHEWYLRTSRM